MPNRGELSVLSKTDIMMTRSVGFLLYPAQQYVVPTPNVPLHQRSSSQDTEAPPLRNLPLSNARARQRVLQPKMPGPGCQSRKEQKDNNAHHGTGLPGNPARNDVPTLTSTESVGDEPSPHSLLVMLQVASQAFYWITDLRREQNRRSLTACDRGKKHESIALLELCLDSVQTANVSVVHCREDALTDSSC